MRACFSVLLLQPAAVAVVATIVVKNVFCFFIFFSIKTCFFNFLFYVCLLFQKCLYYTDLARKTIG